MAATKVNINGINELDLNLSGTTTATTAAGVTTINNTPAQQITLETNGTANGSQTLLNLKNGTGITITDDGVGDITITGSATGVTSVTASAPLASSGGTTPNISITSPLPVANGGTGTATPSIVAGTNITVTGTWPNQTIAGSASGVTSVAATSPLASSGGTNPTISANLPGGIGVSIYGAVVPNTGLLGFVQVPFNCTINSWTILLNTSGSAQFDVQTSTFAGFPTTTSIVASAPPVVTSAISATSSTLTGWTTTIAAGTVVAFYLTGVSTATIISMTLKVTRT